LVQQLFCGQQKQTEGKILIENDTSHILIDDENFKDKVRAIYDSGRNTPCFSRGMRSVGFTDVCCCL
jgi:hypothetical protein